MNSEQPLLAIDRVSKTIGGTPILRNIDLTVKRGEVVCLIGPSGAGKSTLLRCVSFLDPPDSGGVYLCGKILGYERHGSRIRPMRRKKLAKQRSQIGIVFQLFNLFLHMTALENVMEGPVHSLGLRRKEAKETAIKALEEVGLGNRANAYPHELSGGQQQRVGIARALAMKPRLILFDEPTSALDPELIGDVLRTMESLAKAGLTMLIVTHELQFAERVASRLVVMADGEVVESGSPHSILEGSSKSRTQRYLGQLSGDELSTR